MTTINPNQTPASAEGYRQLLNQLHGMTAAAPQAPAPSLGQDTYVPSTPPVAPALPQVEAQGLFKDLVGRFRSLMDKLFGKPATPAPQPTPTPATKTHTVGEGDTLSAIARRYLGDGNRWPEIYELNKDVIGGNPNLIRPGQVLKLPSGSATVAPPAPTPSAPGGYGSKVADQAGFLIGSGYKYPPNLTDKYYHSPDKVGCCADFVCDANRRAGFDLNGVMKKLGMNPHYCPSMIQYFREHQSYVKGNAGAKVGDTVFFSWDGGPGPDHVAVVTAVDAQGRPTRIMESYDFNKPARERSIGNSLDNILGFGRITKS
ncbi:LysM peptidoglycan-binding domain-containing protein [bacterium]|nr:LysM peptidoglycan-binding domain-containing protein [bacterium]